MHPSESGGLLLARTGGENGDQIDVADATVEIARDQRSEEVETHHRRSGNGADLLADRNQQGVDTWIGR